MRVDAKSINAKAEEIIRKFAAKSKQAVHDTVHEALLEVGRRLVDYSPVGNPALWGAPPKRGYLPGHFINNWQVGIDSVPVGEIPGVDPTGQGSLERMTHLGRWQVGHVYHFVNNVPYAIAIEYGHSTQAPSGVTRLIRKQWPAILNRAARTVRTAYK